MPKYRVYLTKRRKRTNRSKKIRALKRNKVLVTRTKQCTSTNCLGTDSRNIPNSLLLDEPAVSSLQNNIPEDESTWVETNCLSFSPSIPARVSSQQEKENILSEKGNISALSATDTHIQPRVRESDCSQSSKPSCSSYYSDKDLELALVPLSRSTPLRTYSRLSAGKHVESNIETTTTAEENDTNLQDRDGDASSYIIETTSDNIDFTVKGRRIVDLTYFMRQYNEIAQHPAKCTCGKYQLHSESRIGLQSVLHVQCSVCHFRQQESHVEEATAKQLRSLLKNMKQKTRLELMKKRELSSTKTNGASVSEVAIKPDIEMIASHWLMDSSDAADDDSRFVLERTLEDDDDDSVYVLYPDQDADEDEPLPKVIRVEHSPAEVSRETVWEKETASTPVATQTNCASPSKLVTSRSPNCGKFELFKKESEVRIQRERQLMWLDKLLYEERIAGEKAKRRKSEAEAEMAELELQIKRQQFRKKYL